MMRGAWSILCLVVFAGCRTSPEPASSGEKSAPAAGTATSKPAAAAARQATLGAPITAADVSLTEVAKRPKDFENKTIATSGVVTAVCQHAGCWMEIKDEAGEAHVRMHGHSFFVPKSASGHHARVQATVERTDPDEECSQEAAKQMEKPVAKIELDATGVELLD